MNNNIFTVKNIFLNIDLKNDAEVFEFIAKSASKLNICDDEMGLIEKLKEREAISSTGFENGVAIPHTQYEKIKSPTLFFFRLKNGVDWKAMDGNPSKIFFSILVPKDTAENIHIEILGKLAEKLIDQKFLDTLYSSNDKKNLVKLILGDENNETKNSQLKTISEKSSQDFYVAVVACTFGLAHTYLAEQKLLKFAKEHNFDIKVETYGSKGHLNIINKDDLSRAKGVLIAIDKDVDVSHIIHENKYKTRTIDSINDTERIFDILQGKIKISKRKEEMKNFFKIKIQSSSGFAYGKVHNFIRFFALALGILIFILEIDKTNWLIINNNLIEILEYSKLVVAPMIVGLLIYSFTKSETSSAMVGIGLFGYSIFDYIQNQKASSFGLLGSISLAIIAILFITFICKKMRKIVKNRWINGGLHWWTELILFFVALLFIVFTFKYFAFINNVIINWVIEINQEHWWFRWIIASLFFIGMVIDMGGPINKWTIILSTIFMVETFAHSPSQVWLTPITAQVVGITIPGISLWVRSILMGKKIDEQEIKDSKEAGSRAMKGISEGALWMNKKYGWKALFVNIVIGIYVGFVIGFLDIRTFGGYNSIFGALFGFSRDNFLEILGYDLPSFNIGFLLMYLTSTFLGGSLGCLVLRTKKEV